LIAETKNPGVPDVINNTTIPDNEDVIKGLNLSTVNNDCGPNKTQDINLPIVKTVKEIEAPVEGTLRTRM
jgi:hypothetical protein